MHQIVSLVVDLSQIIEQVAVRNGRFRANMTSFTKPEVHNVWHCRQRRTEPRPRVTGTKNLIKFGRVVF